MKNIKVSVVVPVYNVEKYLNRCLETIVNQTLQEIEIILVDDESTDNCPKMCEEWARKDKRIKVIHKKNEGLGMARNTGIENANGQYICFFDSDDYVDVQTLEWAYNFASSKMLDIVMFGLCEVDKKGNVTRKLLPNVNKEIYEGLEVQEILLPDLIAPNPRTGQKTNLSMSACKSLFLTELILKEKWRFVSEREFISEDFYSLLELYKYVKKVGILKESLYYYCENSESLTRTYRQDRYEKIKYMYNYSIDRAKKLGYTNEVIQRLDYQYISNTIGALKLIVRNDKDNEIVKKQEFKNVILDKEFQCVVNRISLKNETFLRKIFFESIRKKMCNICYIIVKMKYKS